MTMFDKLTPVVLGPVATAAIHKKCKDDFGWETSGPVSVAGPVYLMGMFQVEVTTTTETFLMTTQDRRLDTKRPVPQLHVLFPVLKETV